MKGLFFALAFGLAAGNVLAQESDAAFVRPNSDWRKALNAEYKFAGTASDLPAFSLPQLPELFTPADMTVTRLPAFIVREPKIDFVSLHSLLRQSEDNAKNAEIASKLGTGVHEIRGKHVSLVAVTIFYIPIQFGVKW